MAEGINFLQRFKKVLEQNQNARLLEKSNQLFMEQGPLYKENFASRFVLVPHTQIDSALQEDFFYVSKKIDGEMRTVYFDGQKARMYSTGGRCEENFPCLAELSETLIAKGIKTAAFGAELNFLKDDGSRSRVTDVIRALAEPSLHSKLALSPYDIIFINGKLWNEKNYGQTHQKLTELFGKNSGNQECAAEINDEAAGKGDDGVAKTGDDGVAKTGNDVAAKAEGTSNACDEAAVGCEGAAEGCERTAARREETSKRLVCPVELEEARSAAEVKAIYEKWVVKQHAEGLVVHTRGNVIYKIKPHHTVDAAVAGYTISTENGVQQIRDLLFAVMDKDWKFRIFASGGNGLTRNQRTELLARLLPLRTDSNYIYTDSRGIAFTMVRPEIIFETSAIDFSSQNSRELPNKNDVLTFENGSWNFLCKRNGVSTYSLSVIREREDKASNVTDIRTSQISDICPFQKEDENQFQQLNQKPSVMLLRRVYKKETRNSIYVKKFYLWKTNKEASEHFPAFVFQYSYFSSRSKNLSKKVLVSSSVDQLKEKFDSFIAKEIKKGWEYVQQI